MAYLCQQCLNTMKVCIHYQVPGCMFSVSTIIITSHMYTNNCIHLAKLFKNETLRMQYYCYNTNKISNSHLDRTDQKNNINVHRFYHRGHFGFHFAINSNEDGRNTVSHYIYSLWNVYLVSLIVHPKCMYSISTSKCYQTQQTIVHCNHID